MNIPISINADEKGYYDRQCPNNDCEFVFKIKAEDWKEKVSDEVVYCPLCGYQATSDKWFTNEQVEEMKKIVLSFAKNCIQKELNKTFKELEKSTRSNKYFNIEYKPGKQVSFINNPIGAKEEWALDITCEKCGTRYSVIGSAFFCPCCGYNAVDMVLNESLNTVEKMINSLNDIKCVYIEKFGQDVAETMCRTMLEGTLGDIVSAFQKYAESIFTELSPLVKVRVNDFQIVSKGSELYRNNIGKGYDEWLTNNELKTMNLMFQRRHIIEHNNGVIDAKYIEKSGDKTYKIGQRMIVHERNAIELLSIIRKLCSDLNSLL